MKDEKKTNTAAMEIMDSFRSLVANGPNHGIVTLSIHFRDGVPHRLESSRNESIFIKNKDNHEQR